MAEPIDELKSLVGLLNRVQEWTIAGDQRISVVTAIQAIVCGFLFPELRDWVESAATSGSIKVMVFTGAVLLASGIAVSIYALFPRIDPPEPSVTFFGTIQAWTLEDYRDRLTTMNDDAWRKDYIAQIHQCAKIATQKYRLIRYSVLVFCAGIGVIAVAYFAAL